MSRALMVGGARVMLCPHTDPHAREALSLYASMVEGGDPPLAAKLRALLQDPPRGEEINGHFDTLAFTDRLREERARHRLSTPQMGAQVGVSVPTISRIENGSRPDLDSMMRLCQWMNASPLDFWVREENKP